MKWIVIDTIIQPSCGISFSAIWGNMKMIIWYQSTIFLPPGSIFTPVKSGIILKDKEYPITIYNIAPFNKDLGNDSNLLIVFYVQIMPDDFVMQLHRF